MNTSVDNKHVTIPAEIISHLEQEIAGINHGSGILQLFIRDGRLHRYSITREGSYLLKNGDDKNE